MQSSPTRPPCRGASGLPRTFAPGAGVFSSTAGFRNRIACLSSIAKYGQFFLDGKPFQIALYFEQDRISRSFCPFSPGRQNRDLLEAHTFGRSKPVNAQIFEVIGQETSAGLEPRLRNHEDQNAVRFEPAISVFKKNEFEPLVSALA